VTPLLAGRVALITGAGRGIGARTAQRFAQNGAKVAVNYLRNRTAAEAVVRAICDAGGQAIAVPADVRDADAVARMVASVTERLGPPDTLVLNADAGGFRPTPVLGLDSAAYESRLLDEVQAAYTPVEAVLPSMLHAGRGTIVAISSALCRAPVPGFSVLAVSKAALEALVRALAVELGPHGIRVNTVEASVIRVTTATSSMTSSRNTCVNRFRCAASAEPMTSRTRPRWSPRTLRASSTAQPSPSTVAKFSTDPTGASR
jgi:3-oxoacyl-[acyl-carrier protein] reductase